MYAYTYILLGKARTLLEWADACLSKKLEGKNVPCFKYSAVQNDFVPTLPLSGAKSDKVAAGGYLGKLRRILPTEFQVRTKFSRNFMQTVQNPN